MIFRLFKEIFFSNAFASKIYGHSDVGDNVMSTT